MEEEGLNPELMLLLLLGALGMGGSDMNVGAELSRGLLELVEVDDVGDLGLLPEVF